MIISFRETACEAKQLFFQTDSTIIIGTGLCLFVFLLAYFFSAAFAKNANSEEVGRFTGASTVAALVAFFAGNLTGLSRDPAVGDVAPVLLTGGGALFLMGVFQQKVSGFFAGFLTVTFTLVFFLGANLGAIQRTYGSVPVSSKVGEQPSGNGRQSGCYEPPDGIPPDLLLPQASGSVSN